MKRVFLSGEGRHELGGWVNEPPHHKPGERGVLEALLSRCGPGGWSVAGALCWKKIPKYRAGAGIGGAEARAVRGLVVLAEHGGYDILAFVRDSDKMLERVEEIADAIPTGSHVAIIGGAAVRTIDAWCLAMKGEKGTEKLRTAKARLEASGCADTADRVAVVDKVDLDALPEDAHSLREWVTQARAVLGR